VCYSRQRNASSTHSNTHLSTHSFWLVNIHMGPTKCIWDPHDLVGPMWILTNQSMGVCWKMCVRMCVASIPPHVTLKKCIKEDLHRFYGKRKKSVFFLSRRAKAQKKRKNYKITLTLLDMQASDKSSKRRFWSSLGGTSRMFTSHELWLRLKLASQSVHLFHCRQVCLKITCHYNFERYWIWRTKIRVLRH